MTEQDILQSSVEVVTDWLRAGNTGHHFLTSPDADVRKKLAEAAGRCLQYGPHQHARFILLSLVKDPAVPVRCMVASGLPLERRELAGMRNDYSAAVRVLVYRRRPELLYEAALCRAEDMLCDPPAPWHDR